MQPASAGGVSAQPVGPAPLQSGLVGARNENRLAKAWAGLSPYVHDKRRLVLLACTSLIGGFAEAFLLFLVVRSAVAIAAGDEQVRFALGPASVELSVVGLLGVALAALVVMLLLGLVAARTTAHLSSAAMGRARRRTMAAYLRASWAVQSAEREGRLQEMLSGHVTRISNGVVTLSGGITAALNFAALMLTALFVNSLAAGVIIVGVVALFFCLRPLTRRTKRQSREQAKASSLYASSIAQTVRLSPELQVFGVSEAVLSDVTAASGRVEHLVYQARFLQRATPAVYQNVALLLVILGMITVYVADLGNVADLGAVVLLMVRALSYSQQVQSAVQSASELTPFVDDLLDQTQHYEEHAARNEGKALLSISEVRLDHASFAYRSTSPVLQDITFRVAGGEVIGIVGPSGSGKSTLVQVLLRLRSLDVGDYLIDGLPASMYDSVAWTEACTYVPQDNKLLSGSIADNVRFFRDAMPHADVERACRLAHLHDEVMGLAEGYDTIVGSGGADLSGGQRQRLGLARALATRPSMLVLDEPTSALDMRSEALVQETLRDIKRSLTIFIVAHRMSTLATCDRIMVLRGGHIEAFAEPGALRSNEFFAEAMRISEAVQR